jgi:hypothetical protein
VGPELLSGPRPLIRYSRHVAGGVRRYRHLFKEAVRNGLIMPHPVPAPVRGLLAALLRAFLPPASARPAEPSRLRGPQEISAMIHALHFHPKVPPGIAILAAPLAFALGFLANYALVPWACASGRVYVLHVVTLAALLCTLASGGFAWRERRREAERPVPNPATEEARLQFLAVLDLSLSGLFGLILVALWIPQFVLDPCMR